MKILSIRRGFATNSSSSHYIVLGKSVPNSNISLKGIPFKEIMKYLAINYKDGVIFHSYVETKNKVETLAVLYHLIYTSLTYQPLKVKYTLLKEVFEGVVDFPSYKEWSKIKLMELDDDYRSYFKFEKKNMKALVEMFSANDIVIESKFEETDGNDIVFPYVIARKIGKNTYTIFNKQNGLKIRFGEEIDKGSVPELVDLKITNRCNKMCKFCYQNSLPTGKDADRNVISDIISYLGKRGVLEVVLGGGEPTLDPNLSYYLERLAQEEIVPSFTTATDGWLQNSELVETVSKHVKKIGVSVNSRKDLKVLENITNKFIFSNVTLMAHIVLGANTYEKTYELLYDLIYDIGVDSILLLGWKDTGRGQPKEEMERYIPILEYLYRWIKRTEFSALAVDTAFLNVHPFFEWLKEREEISRLTYDSREGKFSMYIDGIERFVAASSYDRKKYHFENVEEIDKIWEVL